MHTWCMPKNAFETKASCASAALGFCWNQDVDEWVDKCAEEMPELAGVARAHVVVV